MSLHWNPGLCGLSHSPINPPGLSTHTHTWHHPLCQPLSCFPGDPPTHKCETTWSPNSRLTCPHPTGATLPLILSASAAGLCPLTSLNEIFFFNSLVVGLPYSSIFWQFWLFFVFKSVVVVLLLVVQGGKVYLLMPPSWPEVQENLSIIFLLEQ